jgi:uncharacterized protein YktA (UPF0223 family)
MVKLYFIKAFRKEKKFDLIYGKELKSVVIRGKLEEKIIERRLERNSGVSTWQSFSRTTVNRATNSCYLVYGIHYSKSFSKLPNGKINVSRI